MDLRTGKALAALLTVPGIGPKRAERLIAHFPTVDALLQANPGDLREAMRADLATAHTDLPSAFEHLDDQHPWTVVSRFDPDYPSHLRAIPDAPLLLWVRGTLPPSTPSIAVVGTRHVTDYGKTTAAVVSAAAASQGIHHVSGLAHGADLIGHQAALDAGGRTWAVLGEGLASFEIATPSGPRADTARRILDTGGGLISEQPPTAPRNKGLLIHRNRIQSGITTATVIAQSGIPSDDDPAGAMHTARYAIEQRRLLAVPLPPASWAHEPRSAGNLALCDPNGIDPRHLYVKDPQAADTISARRPAADLVIKGREWLPALWAAIRDHHAGLHRLPQSDGPSPETDVHHQAALPIH